jgi:hypothetical protein
LKSGSDLKQHFMKKAIWISYDLGIEGDYQGLYKWLDKNKAIECGDSFAFIQKELPQKDCDIPQILKDEIKEYATIKKKDRIYIIYRNYIDNKVKGKFLFGARKRSPWEGFAEINGLDSIDTLEDE